MILFSLLTACGPEMGGINVTLTNIEWGDIDFIETTPPEGYMAVALVVTNTQRPSITVEITDFDYEHLILGAVFDDGVNPSFTLSTLEQAVITVGVGDYADGERDTLIEGSFKLTSEQLVEASIIQWSFKPILDL
jgi:hypothetical protein